MYQFGDINILTVLSFIVFGHSTSIQKTYNINKYGQKVGHSYTAGGNAKWYTTLENGQFLTKVNIELLNDSTIPHLGI